MRRILAALHLDGLRAPTFLGILGLLLVVGGSLALVDRDAPIGEVPPASVSHVVPDTPRVTETPPPTAPPAPSPEPTASPAPPEAAPVSPPVALELPSLDVAAEVVDVGLEPDGAMEIPEDVATVGWYDLGVAPGAAGSAVIAGHVDSRSQGPGAFFDLIELELGDTATVAHADGTASRWQVTGRTSYPKDEAPLPELFRRGGDTQLTLITCGGEFDAGERSYADNVVVVLSPA